MAYTHLRNGIGFINVDDIFDRIKYQTHPNGETQYRIQRVAGRDFAVMGQVYENELDVMFHFYARERELYFLVCEMALEAVNRMVGYELVVEDWLDESN